MLSIPPWWARLVRSAVLTPIFGASAFALDAVVSFNEFMYHPRDGEVEWVEVHNMMTVDVDLSEWRLSGGVNFEFATGTVIPGGGYLVIEGAGGGGGAPLGPFSGSLNNNGERIRLRNNSDRVMDEIDFGDSGRWPVAADGSGATLAKRSPRLASGSSSTTTADIWFIANRLQRRSGFESLPLHPHRYADDAPKQTDPHNAALSVALYFSSPSRVPIDDAHQP